MGMLKDWLTSCKLTYLVYLSCSVFDGTKPVLVIKDPALIEQIFIKADCFHCCGVSAAASNDITARFISSLSGEAWTNLRALIAPTLSTGNVKRLSHIFKACSDSTIKALEMFDGDEVALKPFMDKYALSVIAKSCFSASRESHAEPSSDFHKNFAELFHPNYCTILLSSWLPSWLFKLLNLKLFCNKSLNYFKQTISSIIAERRKSGNKQNDYLQLLLDASNSPQILNKEKVKIKSEPGINQGATEVERETPPANQGLQDIEIIAQCILFFFGGYQTVSKLLVFALHQLSLKPEMQIRLRKEVSAIRLLPTDAMMALPFLDAFLRETLRFYPIVRNIERIAVKDQKLAGIDITRGTKIRIPAFDMHRDGGNIENPNEFLPERFLGEGKDKMKPFTFFPFGIGPRRCPGFSFAILECKMFLSAAVLAIEFKASSDVTSPFVDAGAIVTNVKKR